MIYSDVKHLHMTCVALSYGLFVWRGTGQWSGRPVLTQGWGRWLPHGIDTLLLSSAIGLAIMSHQYPIQSGWLTAKLVGLLAYILLGTVALKRGKTRRTRLMAWIAAQAVFAYIVAVALTRSPLPFWIPA